MYKTNKTKICNEEILILFNFLNLIINLSFKI